MTTRGMGTPIVLAGLLEHDNKAEMRGGEGKKGGKEGRMLVLTFMSRDRYEFGVEVRVCGLTMCPRYK